MATLLPIAGAGANVLALPPAFANRCACVTGAAGTGSDLLGSLLGGRC
jgi:hypothetical protein